MRLISLSLITLILFAAVLQIFGRDEGLPENRLGRSATPAASVAETPATPEPAPASAPEPEPATIPAPVATPAPVAEPEPTSVPQPAPPPVAEAEPAPPVIAEPAQPKLYVTGTKVNVRSGPDTVYPAISSLTLGTEVGDLGNAGAGWRMIRLPSGETGYMSGDFLSPVAP